MQVETYIHADQTRLSQKSKEGELHTIAEYYIDQI